MPKSVKECTDVSPKMPLLVKKEAYKTKTKLIKTKKVAVKYE